jgi:hypothetical protein
VALWLIGAHFILLFFSFCHPLTPHDYLVCSTAIESFSLEDQEAEENFDLSSSD